MTRFRAAAVAAIAAVAMLGAPTAAWGSTPAAPAPALHEIQREEAAVSALTVATVDAQLTRTSEGELVADLTSGNDPQALQLSSAVQSERPDVLVLTNVDVDADGEVLASLRDDYFGAAASDGNPLHFNYSFAAATNAGLQSGTDLDGDGVVGGSGDAYGSGDFPGQSSMIVFSSVPIDTANVRTFDDLLWQDVPGNSVKDAGLGSVAAATIPLQSTSLWDIPVGSGGSTVHIVATSTASGSSAADQVRRTDQLSFLRSYVAGSAALKGLADDKGREGGLASGAKVVVAGSLGADLEETSPALTDSKVLIDPEQRAGASSPVALSWWGSAMAELFEGENAATRMGPDDQLERADYVLAGTKLTAGSSGLTDAVENDGVTTRLVWLTLGN